MVVVHRLCAKKERRLKLVSQEETIAELNKLFSQFCHEIDGKDQTIPEVATVQAKSCCK
jgi:hypothetical protein